MSDRPYTKKQGQYLAYIHTYTLLHRRPPSHADMIEFFRVTPPSVVSMLNRLQSRGLIAREPGVARSVRVLLAREELPPLLGPDEVAPDGSQPPAPAGRTDDEFLDECLGAIYQLRIDLDDARPPIWRRVLVSADSTFEDLHAIIQAAMGWGGYHMHVFTAQGWDIGAPEADEPWMTDTLDEDLEVVSDYLIDVGDRIKYEYDFGDGWMHTIKLEKITEPDPKEHYPVCVKGRRACPPDDVGGIWGYADFLEVLGDPSHPEYDEISEWIGGEFDPEAFNLEEVNARLGAIEFLQINDPRHNAGTPHVLTIRRWQMIDPDVPWEAALIIALYELPPDVESLGQRFEVPETPKSLVDALWDLNPLLIDLWADRVVSCGTSSIPFLVDGFTAAERLEHIEDRVWCRDHIILALERLGTPAIPGLLRIYETAPRPSRALICMALGRLGARDHADLIYREISDYPLDDGTGAFIGPLWALIDLGDPRAADVLSELLVEGIAFHELWAMLSRAGDARVLFPLLVAGAEDFEGGESEVAFTLAAVARRLGRQASIEALQFLGEARAPDGTPVPVADLVDVILSPTEAVVDARFDVYYRSPSQEEVAEIVARLALQQREYAALDWDEPDEQGIFGDVTYFDDDAPEDYGGIIAFQGRPRVVGPSASQFPNGRPLALPGRNDPCWCGSGKKYKHCHWREDHLGDTG